MRYVLAGEREQRVAAVLCGVERQHQNQKTDAGAGEVKILERVLGACAHAAVTDADQRQEIYSDEAKLRRTKPGCCSRAALRVVIVAWPSAKRRPSRQAGNQKRNPRAHRHPKRHAKHQRLFAAVRPIPRHRGDEEQRKAKRQPAGAGVMFSGWDRASVPASDCPAAGSGCNPICAGIEIGLLTRPVIEAKKAQKIRYKHKQKS